jgi:uncharacterized protein (DUF924 family)
MSAECPAWVTRVLTYWFTEVGSAGWFTKSDATDTAVRERFLALYETLAADIPEACYERPDAALAGVVVLDQFSRNMFRGSGRSFAADPAAVMLATHAIARRFDRDFTIEQRLLLYLPFEHAESLALQERSVRLIGALGDPRWTDYAERHRVIIARFGRFPHRNAALGRTTGPEEAAFLSEPGSSF